MSHSYERELRAIARGEPIPYKTPKEPPLAPGNEYTVIRSAGSIGEADLTLFRRARTILVEVKATSNRTQVGGTTLNLTANGGTGLEQRDALLAFHERHAPHNPGLEAGFALRAKGRLAKREPRWTWHPIESVRDQTQIHANTGVSLLEHLRRTRPC